MIMPRTFLATLIAVLVSIPVVSAAQAPEAARISGRWPASFEDPSFRAALRASNRRGPVELSMYVDPLATRSDAAARAHWRFLASLENLVALSFWNDWGSRGPHLAFDDAPILPQVRTLSAEGVGMSIAGITRAFPRLSALRYGSCAYCNTDAVEPLASLDDLRELSLPAQSFSDADLTTLARLPRLERATLSGTMFSVTEDGLCALESMPRIRDLRMGVAAEIPERAIEELRAAHPDAAVEVLR
jgi:hypothetical protein